MDLECIGHRCLAAPLRVGPYNRKSDVEVFATVHFASLWQSLSVGGGSASRGRPTNHDPRPPRPPHAPHSGARRRRRPPACAAPGISMYPCRIPSGNEHPKVRMLGTLSPLRRRRVGCASPTTATHRCDEKACRQFVSWRPSRAASSGWWSPLENHSPSAAIGSTHNLACPVPVLLIYSVRFVGSSCSSTDSLVLDSSRRETLSVAGVIARGVTLVFNAPANNLDATLDNTRKSGYLLSELANVKYRGKSKHWISIKLLCRMACLHC
ncbi:hypothetical protein EVAR_19523_1 [Eumeta japonica]|uniref:Uncharacterized protein n=1 Tax=Eumeta variegata TaxID=151549 RepID=A0A4C1UEY1_EUMVA|nr:hypothetical protein EVAR_19523_1 [Eumeta japonica]